MLSPVRHGDWLPSCRDVARAPSPTPLFRDSPHGPQFSRHVLIEQRLHPVMTMRRAAATITGPKGGSWDVFIGLEVHAQIQLRSKLFSRSQAAAPSEHDEPNSRYCCL